MSKLVVKLTLFSDLYKSKKDVSITSYKYIYDVHSIGKKVNCTLRSETSDDIKKRFAIEEFGTVQKDSSYNSNRASIKYLVESEDEIVEDEVFDMLYEVILDDLNKQIERFTHFRDSFVKEKSQIKKASQI